MILIIFGPPGAGKGTQAKLISQYFNIPHLSTGDILRNQLNKSNKLSMKLKTTLDSGQLVSDEILNNIIITRINEKDCLNGFILDGYPRTMIQAKFLNNTLKEKKVSVNFIFDFFIDELTIIKRIKSRSQIENRNDDNAEVIKTRINRYYKDTKPLSDYYKNQYMSQYIALDGNKEIQQINSEILKILKND